jgi:hypothetical protein
MQSLAESAGVENSSLPAVPPQSGDLAKIAETGGPAGPEPTRYGDWERAGRCIDF